MFLILEELSVAFFAMTAVAQQFQADRFDAINVAAGEKGIKL